MQNPDIEAVDLVIPINDTPSFIEKAFNAGKHVISEKPLAPTVAIGKSLIALFEKKRKTDFPGLVWAVAEQIWFEPSWDMLFQYREKAKSQGDSTQASPASFVPLSSLSTSSSLTDVGKPILATLTRFVAMNPSNKYYSTKWRAVPKYQGGYILDGGVHEMAKLRMILGEVDEVTCTAHQHREDLPPVDTLIATLRFKSGVLCSYNHTFTSSSANIAMNTVPYDFTLSAEKGSILASNKEIVIVTEESREVTSLENDRGQLSIRLQLETFALTVRGKPTPNQKPVYSPYQALNDLTLIETILESAKDRKTLKVESHEQQ